MEVQERDLQKRGQDNKGERDRNKKDENNQTTLYKYIKFLQNELNKLLNYL